MKPFTSVIFLLLCLCFCMQASAKHVKGGYIQYTYNGVGSTTGTSNYTITVTVFFSCTVSGPKDQVYLGVYDAVTHATVLTQEISTTTTNTYTKSAVNPCMSNPPSICYEVYTYVYTADLANNANGYILAVQDAYRSDGIVNIVNSSADGITITANMPGTINRVDYHKNNSPTFLFKDTSIICYQTPFSYQFSATDVDGDSLSYSFGNGLNVPDPSANTSSQAPSSPPYTSLTYNTGYSGTSPLGSGVTINPVSGLISGTAPTTTGEYVVAVYVKEWRKGVLMDSVKKELQIYVFDCSLTAATLNTSYINCDNYTFTFENESTSSLVNSYLWNFGVPHSTSDTSTKATPTYTYADTGTYQLKLIVSTSSGCSDSATSVVKVYPGFSPGFTVTGSCYQSLFLFKDTSYVKYGSISSWSWNFGDPSSTSDTSSKQNPSYQYTSPDTVTVTLQVGTSKGCTASASNTVVVSGKPDIYLPFADTLICSIDSLPLIVKSVSGISFKWTPDYNITNQDTTNPVVYPKDTTVYTVTVTDKGCVDSATVTVNVLNYITVSLTPDTVICKTDSMRLNPISYALKYLWTPATGLSDTSAKYPMAAPSADITYLVTANLGKCQASASEKVKVVAYPISFAGMDTSICYGGAALLNGSMTGSSFTWSPAATLSDASVLDPMADPLVTTAYILTVRDTLGCPKPVSDTVLVTVIPKIILSAGNDTAVVVGQPLQLDATSTDSASLSQYTWTPATWLNNTATHDPVATIYTTTVDSITYTVVAATAEGCTGTASVTIKIYRTAPNIFVPSAFTPNGDGNNDLFRPILVGIEKLDYFKVYNRWGQLIYMTQQTEGGWDGKINGKLQETGTYVYMVEGVDYLGKIIQKKGTTVLIR